MGSRGSSSRRGGGGSSKSKSSSGGGGGGGIVSAKNAKTGDTVVMNNSWGRKMLNEKIEKYGGWTASAPELYKGEFKVVQSTEKAVKLSVPVWNENKQVGADWEVWMPKSGLL